LPLPAIDRDIESLIENNKDIDNVTQMMLDGDPEVDLEQVGSILTEVSRVFINPDRGIVHRVNKFEVIREPDGTERERRPRMVYQANVATDIPLRWSGKLIKKDVAIRRLVFVNKMQIMHVNGLTYDFLFEMAKALEDADSMMLIGGGAKSNQPLVLRRGTSPHRGFLEGRTRGDRYCLTLHFANMELKKPSDPPNTDPPATSDPPRSDPPAADNEGANES
jgi:hypothetical protein